MKTSFRIRIITMSLVALVAFTFASKTFAAVNMYLVFTDADGKVTKVSVDQNGNFTTPVMKTGTYSYSWTLVSSPSGSVAKFFGTGRGISSPTGGSADREASAPSVSEVVVSKSADRESSAPSVSEIVVSYEVKAPRDQSTGLAAGKRMHKPFVITKELDRSTPLLSTKLGSAVVDADSDGITGTVSFKMSNGAIVRGWDIKTQK